jgi:hypothetical protein
MEKDNSKMDPLEIGWGNVYYTHVAQDFIQWHVLIDTVRNFQFHKNGTSHQLSDYKLLRIPLFGGGVVICISKVYMYGTL